MINYLSNKLTAVDPHTLEVLKKSSSSTVVKIIGVAFGFIISVSLGRYLGADGLGVINLSNRILVFVLAICMFGVPNSLIKETSIAFSSKNWQQIGNSMHTAILINSSIALSISILGIIFSEYISVEIFNEPRLTIPLIITFAIMPFQVLSRNFSAGMVGFLKIWQSNLVDQALSLVLAVIVLFIYELSGIDINILNGAIAYGIGRFLTFLWAYFYWNMIFKTIDKKKFIPERIFKTAIPFFWVSLTGIILNSVDVLMLGWLTNTEQVGLYTVSLQIAMVTSFFYQVTNSAVSPKVSALFAENRIYDLETMVQKVTLGLILIGGFTLIIFFLLGENLLSIWGDEFKNAYWLLIILGVGQLFNIGTGSVTSVLNMCGLEKIHSVINVVFLLVNILLNYIFIVEFGAIGAATATALTTIIQNLTKVYIAKSKLNILTIPVPFIFNTKE